MKYILVIGIEFKKYKNPAKINLHIGDRFIDTFELANDYQNINSILALKENYCFEKFDRILVRLLESTTWADIKIAPIPQFYKVYEIEEEYLKDFLEIHVYNSNSDYTNGFMNQSSLIRLSIVCLFPAVLGRNNGENLRRICSNIDEWADKYRERSLKPKWRPNTTWPIAESFVEVRYDENSQDKNQIKNQDCWIGGSFIARFPIRSKYKIKYLGSSAHKDKGFVNTAHDYIQFISSYKPLLNMYNEDQ
jgi:hypothetical protein